MSPEIEKSSGLKTASVNVRGWGGGLQPVAVISGLIIGIPLNQHIPIDRSAAPAERVATCCNIK